MSKVETGFGIAKSNYKILLIGIGLIALGYILMIGGGSDDPAKFNPEIFNTQRIVIAPVVCLAGFVVIIAAIMRKGKHKSETSEE